MTDSRTYRVVTAVFGILFAVLAIVIVFISDWSVPSLLVALVFGVLGVDAVASAIRDRSSLLSRIGPLP